MGFIGGLMGAGGKGAGFEAQKADIQQGVTPEQVAAANAQAASGVNQQQAFVNALGQQGGLQNQQAVFGQQQGLANQLQGLANGTGPNPAQNMLNQATGANVAQQAALMGGQRGVGANAGMMARQIGQQGAGIQQQAAGQAATMGANQQIAGMNSLQNQQGMMGNMANQQVGQQQTGLNAFNQFAQGNQANNLGAVANQNTANVQMQSNMNTTNEDMQKQQAGKGNQMLGGLMGAAGTVFGGPLGGMVASQLGNSIGGGKAYGGMIDGPQSYHGKYMMQGGAVPGKASTPGDSFKNDKVKTNLSPGEIVVPRSITMGANPEANAAKFVAAVLAKKRGMGR